MECPGDNVIGLTIMPLSDRLTRSTSEACSSIDRFLWITPRPPCCAMAIASPDSVTVSIAALTSGTFRRMLRVSRVVTSTWVGRTVECCGTSSTSSNVRAVTRPVSVDASAIVPVFRSIIWCPRGRLTRPQYDEGPTNVGPFHLSCGCPVAFLVFFSAPAGARVVAAHLRTLVPYCLDHVVAAGARGSGRFPPAAAHGRRGAGRARKSRHRLGRRVVHRQRGGAPGRGPRPDRRLLVQHRTKVEEIPDHLFLDARLHVLEEREALLLVLDERVALAVAAQADAFLEMVEAVEVVLPLLVDDLEHDIALDAPQQLSANDIFL